MQGYKEGLVLYFGGHAGIVYEDLRANGADRATRTTYDLLGIKSRQRVSRTTVHWMLNWVLNK